MEQSTLLQKIESIPWSEFAQPEWNEPESVPLALSCAANACDAESCNAAYDKVLYALGNNHAGTYYPVLIAALPVIESMIRWDSLWPQRAALCLLDDLFASFAPEPGYERANIGGEDKDMAVAFRSGARSFRPMIQHLAHGNGPNAQLASDLVMLMSDSNDGCP